MIILSTLVNFLLAVFVALTVGYEYGWKLGAITFGILAFIRGLFDEYFGK